MFPIKNIKCKARVFNRITRSEYNINKVYFEDALKKINFKKMKYLEKKIKIYLTKFKHSYMFIDKDNKYKKDIIISKIYKYKKILNNYWPDKKKNNGLAILLDRNVDYICLILATWLCKGFYLPLSLNMPKINIRNQIRESGINLIVTNKNGKIIFNRIKPKKNKFFKKKIAYIIFTSGSTGKKKGVCIPYSALESYIKAIEKKFYGDKGFKSLIINGELTFDITIADFVFALVFKSTIAITEDSKNLISLISMISINKIEALYLVPSALNKLLTITKHINKNNLISIKRINLGGENLNPLLIENAKKIFKKTIFYNFYGPTEFTVNSLFHKINNKRKYLQIPIGKPLDGIKYYLKKKNNDDQGELYLSGKQSMLGYVNCKFYFKKIKNKSYYPTGDIVRINKKKEIIYISRKKDYIKFDGYRINLTRIENLINKKIKMNIKLALVQDKITLFVENSNNKNKILKKLNLIFQKYLEAYEKPSIIRFFKRFPYLESGKVNIKYLKEETI